jgi:photosystem II stability/assembly factor-like uncharacterized protein
VNLLPKIVVNRFYEVIFMWKKSSYICKLRFYLVVLLFILSTNILSQQLNLEFEPPYRLKYIQSFTNGEIWSVGGFGNLVLNTGDKRSSFTLSKSDLNSIFFVNNRTIFIVGDNGEILLSLDRGKSWKKQRSNVSINLNSIFCFDKTNCWIVGNSGLILKGGVGKKWIKNLVSDKPLQDIFMINNKVGFAVGNDDAVFRTDNGGKVWKIIRIPFSEKHFFENAKIFLPTGAFWNSVFFRNVESGCISGVRVVSCTTDGGVSWVSNTEFTNENIIGDFIGILYQNSSYYMVDRYGKNLSSNDFGKTWK